MWRFTFRLENVLRIRKKLEESAERDFSRASAALIKAKADLKSSVEKLKGFIRENPLDEGVFTASEMIAVDNYIAFVEREIGHYKIVQEEKQGEVNRVFTILLEAKKARKVIENLKQRKLERYAEESNREETIALDDITQKIGMKREKLTVEDVPIEDM